MIMAPIAPRDRPVRSARVITLPVISFSAWAASLVAERTYMSFNPLHEAVKFTLRHEYSPEVPIGETKGYHGQEAQAINKTRLAGG